MIDSVASFLGELIRIERIRIDSLGITHAPTIGEMYEGLAAEVLRKSLPARLELTVADGFICDDSGALTPQIDSMIMRGRGLRIPHTDKVICHVRDVIAVLEIKKSLHAREFQDGFVKMREVLDSHSRFIQGSPSGQRVDIGSARKAFAEITGRVAPPYDRIQELGFEDEMIFHTLLIEQISPVRIVFGYDGYKSESAFRLGVREYLGSEAMREGSGPNSFPSLAVSGNYSMLKLNGQPYRVPRVDNDWLLLGTSRLNPLVFLLELIWTRISLDHPSPEVFGEDLEIENINPFLWARAARREDRSGWLYKHENLSEEALGSAATRIPWEPALLDDQQFAVMNSLCIGKTVRIDDAELKTWLADSGRDLDEFIASLVETHFVAVGDGELKLVTEGCVCVIMPDGRMLAGENNTGRFERWMARAMGDRR